MKIKKFSPFTHHKVQYLRQITLNVELVITLCENLGCKVFISTKFVKTLIFELNTIEDLYLIWFIHIHII